jgi:hypothetical protein
MQSEETKKNIIGESSKPFPDWLKNHEVFKRMGKIEKVFPRLGLPNFKTPCDIANTAEAQAEATKVGNKIRTNISTTKNTIFQKLEEALSSNAKNRSETCAELQSCADLFTNIERSLSIGDYVKVNDGKISLKLRADIFNWDKNPVFRKNEAVFGVYTKLQELATKFTINMEQLDQLPEFKNFSRVNIPSKKYNLVFSSYGEEGAWDIATISMRGISSCQAWTQTQSRGLIGSVASKFVAVMYLSSDQDIPGYGSKMLNRCMVRFAINKTTKKPALIMDSMYPQPNEETIQIFMKVLKEKSGLDVHYTRGYNSIPTCDVNNFYIPTEPSLKILQPQEVTYMDTKIPFSEQVPAIKKVVINLDSKTIEFKRLIAEEINNMVNAKAELYEGARKEYDAIRHEYDAARAKWMEENVALPEDKKSKFELIEPKMDPLLDAFGGGGISNLLKHCDKKHPDQVAGKEHKGAAGKVFATTILNAFLMPPQDECETPEEFHRKFLMNFLKCCGPSKVAAWKACSTGTWMKSFPRSAEKFFEFIFAQMRPHILAECKAMIKKAN